MKIKKISLMLLFCGILLLSSCCGSNNKSIYEYCTDLDYKYAKYLFTDEFVFDLTSDNFICYNSVDDIAVFNRSVLDDSRKKCDCDCSDIAGVKQ